MQPDCELTVNQRQKTHEDIQRGLVNRQHIGLEEIDIALAANGNCPS